MSAATPMREQPASNLDRVGPLHTWEAWKPAGGAAWRGRHIRLAELRRLIIARHGPNGCPSEDAGCDYLMFAAAHLPDAPMIRGFARELTPAVSDADVEAIAAEAAERPRRVTADQAAAELRVTSEERRALALKTIAALGEDLEARKVERRRKDAEAKRAARAALPKRVPATVTEPWKAFGWCRRTWERRGKPSHETAVANGVGNNNKNIAADRNCDTPRLTAARPWEAEGISRAQWYRRRKSGKGAASAAPPTTDAHRLKAPNRPKSLLTVLCARAAIHVTPHLSDSIQSLTTSELRHVLTRIRSIPRATGNSGFPPAFRPFARCESGPPSGGELR